MVAVAPGTHWLCHDGRHTVLYCKTYQLRFCLCEAMPLPQPLDPPPHAPPLASAAHTTCRVIPLILPRSPPIALLPMRLPAALAHEAAFHWDAAQVNSWKSPYPPHTGKHRYDDTVPVPVLYCVIELFLISQVTEERLGSWTLLSVRLKLAQGHVKIRRIPERTQTGKNGNPTLKCISVNPLV